MSERGEGEREMYIYVYREREREGECEVCGDGSSVMNAGKLRTKSRL